MNAGKMVFSQLMEFLPAHEFQRCVVRHGGHYKMQSFTCWTQFLAMAFAQLTYRESLRDIEACLHAIPQRLYHMGIRGRVARSTLADANESRDWRIFEGFGQVLIRQARSLYAGESLGLELDHAAYALDATTVDLCLSLFPWARFRRHKGAVKLHTLLDLRGSIPCFVHITDGKIGDVTALDEVPLEPGAFYIMDRAYIDFLRLHAVTQSLAFFVVRGKRNHDYSRRHSRPVDRTTGLRSDQSILLKGPKSSRLYPEPLRRVTFFDEESHKRFVLLTNNFALPALTIAQLYKSRWTIELFFKWIKQNLRIKAFYGTSENAVKTQVWIAITTYVLVAIVKKRLDIGLSLQTMLQIISMSIFEKVPIHELLSENHHVNAEGTSCNPLLPFNL
jgi:hypothetical protein